MHPNTPIAIAVSLCLLAGAQGCRRSETASPSRAESIASEETDVARVAVENDENGRKPNRDCWWHHSGESELAVAWVSPRLSGEVEGGFRFVNLFFHDPRSVAPAALVSGVAPLDRADPVSIRGARLVFTVSPTPGKNWSQVGVRDDLKVTLERR